MKTKNILILGSAGMAGHTITSYFKRQEGYSVSTVSRDDRFIKSNFYIDFLYEKDTISFSKILNDNSYDYVINCVGVLVKTSKDNPEIAIKINQKLPHFIEECIKGTRTKLIHLSTDCVFSGEGNGGYTDKDIPDGKDMYAKTKTLGEVVNKKDLTIRMSIIGHELKSDGSGLMDWFLRQSGEVHGFTQAIWNGVTTLELAKNIKKLMNTNISGLYQLAPQFSTSKYELLRTVQDTFCKTDVEIIPDDSFIQNKTLVCSTAKGFTPDIPSYRTQLSDLRYFMMGQYE